MPKPAVRRAMYSDKIIQVDPIRLSADESRLLLRVQRGAGKPVEIWGHQGKSLSDLGLIKIVKLSAGDVRAEQASAWKEIRAGARAEDARVIMRWINVLRDIDQRSGKCGAALTSAGREVAKGLTFRLSRAV